MVISIGVSTTAFEAKETLSLGVYPEISLKDAREKRGAVKKLLEQNTDPSETRKEEKRKQDIASFEDIAKQWWEHQRQTWTEDHANRVWTRLKDNVFSSIGHLSIDEITPKQVIATIKVVEARGFLDVANRVKQHINAVCRYAVQQGIATYNPTGDLANIVKQRNTVHRPSLPREELPKFLRELDRYHERGRLLTQLAIELLLLTFVRSGELRGARWEEFDTDSKLWRIPAERMKMKTK